MPIVQVVTTAYAVYRVTHKPNYVHVMATRPESTNGADILDEMYEGNELLMEKDGPMVLRAAHGSHILGHVLSIETVPGVC